MRRRAQLTLAITLSACAQHALSPPATTSTSSSAAGPTSAAQEPHVANVLRGLRPFVEIAGRPPLRWTLEERMAHHHVPGVSIAVIEGGRIAWARGGRRRGQLRAAGRSGRSERHGGGEARGRAPRDARAEAPRGGAFVAIMGVHFYAYTRDPKSPDFVDGAGTEGIRWLTQADTLHIEDVVVQFYAGTNVTIQGPNPGDIKNVTLRLSIIIDAYKDHDIGHSAHRTRKARRTANGARSSLCRRQTTAQQRANDGRGGRSAPRRKSLQCSEVRHTDVGATRRQRPCRRSGLGD